jgi:hypothetical protein
VKPVISIGGMPNVHEVFRLYHPRTDLLPYSRTEGLHEKKAQLRGGYEPHRTSEEGMQAK